MRDIARERIKKVYARTDKEIQRQKEKKRKEKKQLAHTKKRVEGKKQSIKK